MAAIIADLERVSVNLMVDIEKNQVVLAEAGKEFVDVLLSFLTLPLGTIARLVCKDSNMEPVTVGCLSSLHESVRNMDEKYFWTEACKEMLVNPRNSMEKCCRYMYLNIDDTEPTKYFICENSNCCQMSTYKNVRCNCGKFLNKQISTGMSCSCFYNYSGAVPEKETFVIYDDLKILHQSRPSVINYIGCECEVITMTVSRTEVLDLLKCSLLSKTPLTDFFIQKKVMHKNPELCSPLSSPDVVEFAANQGVRMDVKIILRKSSSKILFALGDENFVNFILSILTLPLGSVEYFFKGNLHLGSIDNVYKSLDDLIAGKRMIDYSLYNKLLKPLLAPQYKLDNQILAIEEACPPIYRGRYSDSSFISFNNFDPKLNKGGLAKGPSMYMVTDDLVVTRSSYISAVSYLKTKNIPSSDLEEREISIGPKEGLSILKAALMSSSALTNGLTPFITRVKLEN